MSVDARKTGTFTLVRSKSWNLPLATQAARQAHAKLGYRPGLCLLARLAEENELKDRTHDEAMAEVFREDPAYAIQLLNSILEDGDQSELLITLRQMTKAFGGVQAVAETAQ